MSCGVCCLAMLPLRVITKRFAYFSSVLRHSQWRSRRFCIGVCAMWWRRTCLRQIKSCTFRTRFPFSCCVAVDVERMRKLRDLRRKLRWQLHPSVLFAFSTKSIKKTFSFNVRIRTFTLAKNLQSPFFGWSYDNQLGGVGWGSRTACKCHLIASYAALIFLLFVIGPPQTGTRLLICNVRSLWSKRCNVWSTWHSMLVRYPWCEDKAFSESLKLNHIAAKDHTICQTHWSSGGRQQE